MSITAVNVNKRFNDLYEYSRFDILTAELIKFKSLEMLRRVERWMLPNISDKPAASTLG
jgi:hypothetical protein